MAFYIKLEGDGASFDNSCFLLTEQSDYDYGHVLLEYEENLSNYNICQRSGYKVRPGALVKDGYGLWVRRHSADNKHPSDMGQRHRAEHLTGSKQPEQEDSFISTAITQDDL